MTPIRFLILACVALPILVVAQVPIGQNPVWQSFETSVYSTGMIWRDCNLDGWIDVLYSNGNDMALVGNKEGDNKPDQQKHIFADNQNHNGCR